jgi:hypothetical protein
VLSKNSKLSIKRVVGDSMMLFYPLCHPEFISGSLLRDTETSSVLYKFSNSMTKTNKINRSNLTYLYLDFKKEN